MDDLSIHERSIDARSIDGPSADDRAIDGQSAVDPPPDACSGRSAGDPPPDACSPDARSADACSADDQVDDPSDGGALAPRRRDDVAVFATAVLMRGVVLCVVLFALGVPLDRYANKGDGESYVLVARSMLGQVRYAHLDAYHHRVFLGYPAMMAALGWFGLPVAVAGLVITLTSAGAAAALAGRFFNDRRVGYAAAALVPHWVVNSSLVMTEAPTLALTLLGLLLARQKRPLLAGAALAAAGLVRPMACFAAAGALVALWRCAGWRGALRLALACGGVFILGTIWGASWRGELFESARIYHNDPRAYGNELITWPFGSLLRNTLHPTPDAGASVGYSIYIWSHVAFVFGGIALLVRRLLRQRRNRLFESDAKAAGRLTALMPPTRANGTPSARQASQGLQEAQEWQDSQEWRELHDLQNSHESQRSPKISTARFVTTAGVVWAIGNTALVLCIGSIWGYKHFPRFHILSQPALFDGWRDWLPRRTWVWLAICGGVTVFAIFGVKAAP